MLRSASQINQHFRSSDLLNKFVTDEKTVFQFLDKRLLVIAENKLDNLLHGLTIVTVAIKLNKKLAGRQHEQQVQNVISKFSALHTVLYLRLCCCAHEIRLTGSERPFVEFCREQLELVVNELLPTLSATETIVVDHMFLQYLVEVEGKTLQSFW